MTSRQCGSACNLRRQVDLAVGQSPTCLLFLCGGKCLENVIRILRSGSVLPYIRLPFEISTPLDRIPIRKDEREEVMEYKPKCQDIQAPAYIVTGCKSAQGPANLYFILTEA
jgi:hypothetical protein